MVYPSFLQYTTKKILKIFPWNQFFRNGKYLKILSIMDIKMTGRFTMQRKRRQAQEVSQRYLLKERKSFTPEFIAVLFLNKFPYC
jgi:hypothetical protein